jgi:hypothetical protein
VVKISGKNTAVEFLLIPIKVSVNPDNALKFKNAIEYVGK